MLRRAFWVWLHRWAGLVMAGFLIVAGLTGSLLAFWLEINHWLTPEMYPGERPGVTLDVAALARRAEEIAPQARTNTVYLGYPGSVMIGMEAREGEPPLDFEYIHLDPIDGHERGRASWCGLPKTKNDVMPFVYSLHMYLALRGIGDWILGLVALVWTIDCFVGFYLTLPVGGERSRKGFLARWTPAWLIKWRGSAYRINFDLHRAFGLWFWAMLLIFAWSSVYMDLNGFYTRAIQLFFDYAPPIRTREVAPARTGAEKPLEWEDAQAAGQRLMEDLARKHCFSIDAPLALSRQREQGNYLYRVRSSRDIGDRDGLTYVVFDAYSGELQDFGVPTGHRSGATVTTWLFVLHTANLFGLPYKIFVSAFGLIVTTLSVTGVYIWWKKRYARINRRVPAGASPSRGGCSWRSVVSVAWTSAMAAAKRTQQSRGVRD